jgi:hypothetical protein
MRSGSSHVPQPYGDGPDDDNATEELVSTQRQPTEGPLSALERLKKALKKGLINTREWIVKWSPVLGTLAAIGFGIFAVFAYNIAREGLEEQKVANFWAYAAIEEARYGNDLAQRANELAELSIQWSFYTYLAQIADLILTEIQMCRENPVGEKSNPHLSDQ